MTTTSGLGTTSGLSTTGLEGTAAGIGAGTYGRVILTLKSAHNMRDKAWLGKSDPYCVVRLADAEIQTHHVKNAGESCVWDESFSFNNVSPDDTISFHVYDHNRLMKDAHMGEGSISLRQVFEEGRLETRVPLTTRTGTKDAGEIWISLRTEGGPAGQGAAGQVAGTGVGTRGYEQRESGYAAGERGYEEGVAAGAAGVGAGVGAGHRHRESPAAGVERRAEEGLAAGATGMGPGYRESAPGAGLERREDEYERRSGMEGATGTTYATGAVPAVGQQAYSTPIAVASAETPAVAVQGQEAVCSQEYFTKVEDRPVMKERVTYLKEHHPVEKEFVVETRATGVERETGERAAEHMGAQEKIVEAAQPVVEQPTAEYFTKTEDRPVMKERVTRVREHHPVEKEFVVETRATGERETGERAEEHMGTTERVVEVAQPRAPCE